MKTNTQEPPPYGLIAPRPPHYNTSLYIGWDNNAVASLHLRPIPGDSSDSPVPGIGGNQNSAMLGVSQLNAADNMPALAVTPKASTTVEPVRFNNSSGHKVMTIDTVRPNQAFIEIRGQFDHGEPCVQNQEISLYHGT